MMKGVFSLVPGGPCVCVCVFVVLYDSYECPFVNKQTEDTWPCPRMHFSTSPLLCPHRLSSGMDLLSERTESHTAATDTHT